jgi:hypothetical protein
MVVAIIWRAKISIVRPTFLRIALVRGNMVNRDTTVIDTLKRKPRQPGMRRKGHELHFKVICSTVIGI